MDSQILAIKHLRRLNVVEKPVKIRSTYNVRWFVIP